MGFEELRNQMCERCGKIPTKEAASFLRVLQNDAAVDCMRNTYKAYSFLKPFWKRKMDCLLKVLEEPDGAEGMSTNNKDLRDLFQHVITYVRHHAHSSDLEVRRWSTICTALYEDAECMQGVMNVLEKVVDDPAVKSALMASLNYTITECNHRGCLTKPF